MKIRRPGRRRRTAHNPRNGKCKSAIPSRQLKGKADCTVLTQVRPSPAFSAARPIGRGGRCTCRIHHHSLNPQTPQPCRDTTCTIAFPQRNHSKPRWISSRVIRPRGGHVVALRLSRDGGPQDCGRCCGAHGFVQTVGDCSRAPMAYIPHQGDFGYVGYRSGVQFGARWMRRVSR